MNRAATRLGRERAELADLDDVSILTYVGCPVYGNEAATLFGARTVAFDVEMRAYRPCSFI